ncbi:MAG: acetolactate synthase large subunit [Actinomycetota bacterium]|jgi:acetolactate synthase-1/2/3 large subunit|nr:acetolactate synthase large subunit [Actinomycetota bacterium]
MPKRRASDLLVDALEAEGVEYVFGIPGEETLDLSESLDRSTIRFVPVRHEQGGAFIADGIGRLTGRAGVALGTLGPGATNLVTAVADAYLDRAPLVVLTGQGDLERMHKESHQYIDVVSLMAPITKWNARVTAPGIVPEAVRKAFAVAETEKPGATHLELPEEVMGATVGPEDCPLGRSDPVRPQPSARSILRSADLIRAGRRVVALAGNGVVRGRAAPALREFSRATGIPVAETFMGKGLIPADDPRSLGATGLQAGDYAMAGFDDADVVVAIGYDLVEQAPRQWNPRRDKTIICIDTLPAEIDAYFMPAAELVGDIYHVLTVLAEELRGQVRPGGSTRLRDTTLGLLASAATDDRFPMQPPRVLASVRRLLGREDVLVSDVGLHKLWIGRMFPAYEPNTTLIANGLAGMGFAVPAAIAAKLVRPDATVVAVSGDGGFMMNVQELETARRLGTAFVNLVWENGQFGSIVWKQDRRFGRHFGTDFTNPDFVALAAAFGLPSWRVTSAADLDDRLAAALALDVPSVIVVPIDYSLDVAISSELGATTTAT